MSVAALRLVSVAWALASCGCADPVDTPAPAASSAARPPDVLIITLDTTRRDALSPYGAPPEVTPVVSRLASHGARFDRAYTVTPLTIPAHSSLFTGVYPPRHGVRDNGDHFLSDSATTLAEHLAGAGYATMASVGAEVTSRHWGFAQGFSAYFDDLSAEAEGERNRWRVERRGDAVADDAVGWLSAQSPAGAPVFVWMHLFDAHHPYEPPDATAVLFPNDPYLGEVAFADMQVGRLLAAQEARDPGLERTWVIVVADHGESMGAHGEGLHGVLLYDETTAVPLVIRPAGGLPAARIVTAPTSLVDLAPTILQAAGVPLPDALDGRDLGPWLGAQASRPSGAERSVYVESLYAWHHYGWAPQRALVSPDLKLIDGPDPELYRRGDAGERRDLAPSQRQVVEGQRARLDALAAPLTPLDGVSGAADLSPDRLAQLEALGYLSTRSEGDDDAVPWRDAALAMPVDRLPVLRRVEEVRQAQQRGDLDAARRAAEALLADEPGLIDPARTLASVLLRQGEVAAAERILADIERRQPSSATKAMLGTTLLRKGDTAGGIALLRAAVEADPYVASPWTPLLHALWLSGDLDGLARQLDEGERAVPEHAVVQGMRGLLKARRGQCEAALPRLRAALDDSPGQPFVRHGLAVCLYSQGDSAEAEDRLAEEVALHPPALASQRLLVELYAEQKRYAEQLETLERIAGTEPPHPLTAHARAQALFNLGRYDQARAQVDRCLELSPDNPWCMLLRANVLHKLDQPDAAKAAFEEAKRLKGLPTTAPEPGPLAQPDRYWQDEAQPAQVAQPKSPVDR